MLLDFCTGFEIGVVSITTFNAGGQSLATSQGALPPTFETVTVKNGARALRLIPSATQSSAWSRGAASGVVATGSKTMGFWFRFVGSLPATDNAGIAAFTGTVTMNVEFDQSTGRLNLGHSGSGVRVDFGPTIVADTWYWIDLTCTLNSTTHTLTGRVDGNAATEGTKSQTGQTSQNIVSYMVGTFSAAGPAYTALVDDWVEIDDSVSYPLGQHVVKLLKPTGDGTHVAGTNVIEDQAGADIGVVTAWNLVDEVPLGDTVDFIRQVAVGGSNYAEVTFADPDAGDVPVGVHTFVAVKGAAANASNGLFRVVDGSNNTLTDLGGSAVAIVSGTTVRYSNAKVAVPSGGDWTEAKLQGIKGRMGFATTDVTPNPHFLGFLLEYAVVASGAAPATSLLIPGQRRRRQLIIR